MSLGTSNEKAYRGTENANSRICLLMAVSRSTASSSGRQFWRKLPLRIEISEVIADPKQTPISNLKTARSCFID